MSTTRKLLSGAFGGVGFTAVSMAISFFQLRVLLHHMSMVMAGIWLIFLNLGNYAMFLDIGLTPTLGREISFASANPNLSEAERSERIGTLVRSCTVIVAALSTLVILVAGPIGWRYLHSITPAGIWASTQAAWAIFIFATALNLLGQGWFAGIYGLGEVFSEKLIRSASAIAGFVFLVIALARGAGLVGCAIAYLLQASINIALARIVLFRATAGATAKGRFDLRLIRDMVGPSLKYAATLLGTILILQTDNLVIASVLGPRLIPDYQAVAKIITALMSLSMMLVMTSMPLMSQAFSRKDISAIVRLSTRNVRYTLTAMIVLGSFVATFSDRVIAVWLGPGHFVGFPIVWVMLVVMVLETHHQSMGAATMATGRIVFVVPALLAGAINIVASVFLAKRYGVLGVVLGTMVAQIGTNNWYAPWYTMRLFGISVKEHMQGVIAPAVGLLAVLLSLGFGLRVVTGRLSNLLSDEISALVVATAGAIGFVLIMVTPPERQTLLKWLRQLGFRWTAAPPTDAL
jgi:O-antigen/teichoic acid export membrane protein